MTIKETFAAAAFGRYVVVGFALCAVLQLIFVGQIGRFGVPLADWPFLLAYSQKAMLDLVVFDAPAPIRIAVWFVAYLAIALLLWKLVAILSPSRAGHWKVVILAWAAFEIVLAALGWGLLGAGLLRME